MRLVQAHTLRERVAQLVEHLTFNQGVMGSNPIALTKGINELAAEICPKPASRINFCRKVFPDSDADRATRRIHDR